MCMCVCVWWAFVWIRGLNIQFTLIATAKRKWEDAERKKCPSKFALKTKYTPTTW